MSTCTVEVNADPLPPISPEHLKGIRLYYPPINPNSKLDIQAVMKRFIDKLTALMNSGQLDRSRAIAEAILLLSDLHD